MWGQDWGILVWNGSVAVPSLGPFGWTFLAGALLGGAAVVFRRSRRASAAGLALVAIAIPLVASGQVALPHVFVNGTPADADEVNANFEALLEENGRYHLTVDATDPGPLRASVPVPIAVTNDLCADVDGCEVLIVVTSQSQPGQSPPQQSTPGRLVINPAEDPNRPGSARYSYPGIVDTDGGQGARTLASAASCSFRDSEVIAAVGTNDVAIGFHLFYSATGGTAASTCTLTLID